MHPIPCSNPDTFISLYVGVNQNPILCVVKKNSWLIGILFVLLLFDMEC